MHTSEYHSCAPALDVEGWRATFSAMCFQCDLESDQPDAFRGWIRAQRIFGLPATDCGFNYGRMGRTQRHTRSDSIDHYAAIITVAGGSTLIQNDRAVTLAVGDIALLDKARPATFIVCGDRPVKWLAVQLPRRTLAAHFGFEPQAGLRAAAGTLVSRALVQLVHEASQADDSCAAQSEPYMQMTVYDMLGALFATAAPSPVSARTHKLFVRVCDIIRNSFTDPDVGPPEVAAEAKISLRYLQMLFTARGLTCTRFIQSLRLDHALRLIRRRNCMNTGQPLSHLAYLCGFRDYNYFARAFRNRFGYPPGDAGGRSVEPPERTALARPGEN
jgi:AraC-like DNA-binding protein